MQASDSQTKLLASKTAAINSGRQQKLNRYDIRHHATIGTLNMELTDSMVFDMDPWPGKKARRQTTSQKPLEGGAFVNRFDSTHSSRFTSDTSIPSHSSQSSQFDRQRSKLPADLTILYLHNFNSATSNSRYIGDRNPV